jgi:DNA-binding transcriptional regulator LsrR (DeoR family)
VCRRYHLDGWTKKAVADHYGLSRFQVARMLQRARDNGWVRIQVDAPTWIDAELGDRVRDILGLRHAVVVRSESTAVSRSELGAATARLLESVLDGDDVVGLAWSRTVAEAVDRLEHVPRVPVVQLTGALPRPDEVGSVELVRRFAAAGGGPAYVFYAPMILSDDRAVETMRRQTEVADAIDRLGEVTVAVVAIGGWAPRASTLYDAMSPADRAVTADHDVIGEVSGIFLGLDGSLPQPPVAGRLLSPSATELAAVPHVIAVVPGEHRGAVVRSAVAAGLADSVVISRTTAEDLVAT